eukprot:753154-Hanusia_phi.AAC.9
MAPWPAGSHLLGRKKGERKRRGQRVRRTNGAARGCVEEEDGVGDERPGSRLLVAAGGSEGAGRHSEQRTGDLTSLAYFLVW